MKRRWDRLTMDRWFRGRIREVVAFEHKIEIGCEALRYLGLVKTADELQDVVWRYESAINEDEV